ncbi:MAG: CPBP family intramembrane glutamic endopeptidase [Bdellovibrionales bacterium]
MENESWVSLQIHPSLKNWLIMWGPAIAAGLVFIFFKKHKRLITLFGTSKWRSLAMFAPLFAILSITNKDPKYLLFSAVAFISFFGEELGWRGFLQDALRPLSKIKRYMLIGVTWEFWHFTNRIHSGTSTEVFKRLLIFYPALILLSALMGELVDRTRSLLVAITLHASVILLLADEIPQGWIAVAGSVPIWIYLFATWPRNNHPINNK